jgi:hypothetical protein
MKYVCGVVRHNRPVIEVTHRRKTRPSFTSILAIGILLAAFALGCTEPSIADRLPCTCDTCCEHFEETGEIWHTSPEDNR